MSDRQLDVLFIHPSSSAIYQGLRSQFSAIEPPTWTLLLAQSMRACGGYYGTEILDCDVNGLTDEEAVECIACANPRLVVFVVMGSEPNQSSVRMASAVSLARKLKQSYSQYRTCFVGNYVQALPKEVLALDCVDYICQNEGVYTLWQLLNKDIMIPMVAGLGWKDEDGPHLNKPSSIVDQANMASDLPGYAWDLLPDLDNYRSHFWHAGYDHSKRSPFAAIYSSLGCPFKCEFCCINLINRTNNADGITAADSNVFRYWPAEHTLKQIEYLVDQGVTTLRFSDEMFFLNSRHYEPILTGIRDRWGDKLNLWSYARVDTVKPKFLELFRSAGVRWLGIGIEAGTKEVRKEASKGSFADVDVRTVVKQVEDADIDVIANFIVGLEGDTYESMCATKNLALELNTRMMNVYAAMCFVPGTMIYTQAGSKPIENIVEGDIVLSQSGSSVVTATMKRPYSGVVLRVKARYVPPITVTEEHPILVAEVKRTTDQTNKPVVGKLGFVNASQLRPFNPKALGDMYHAVVIRKKVLDGTDTFVDFSPFVKGQIGSRPGGGQGGQLGPIGRRYLEKWPVTEELAELFGWYVAEGCISGLNKRSIELNRSARVIFSLGTHEKDRLERIVQLVRTVFGFSARKIIRGSVTQVEIQSDVLARAMKPLCGNDCYTKRVPDFIYRAKPNIVRAFLSGHQQGDGTTKPGKNGQVSVSTASRQLVHDLFLCYLKIGIVPGYCEEKPKVGKSINGRPCNSNTHYHLTWSVGQVKKSLKGTKKNNYLQDEENYYLPIQEILRLEYAGDVYNMETTDHTYCVPYIVHNCLPGTPLYEKAKKDGKKLPDSYEAFGFLSYQCQPLGTDTLTPAEVLKFRDEMFVDYWSRPEFHKKVEQKFGSVAVENIKEMLKVKLKRKLLGD